jgi:micrococcal nuclease
MSKYPIAKHHGYRLLVLILSAMILLIFALPGCGTTTIVPKSPTPRSIVATPSATPTPFATPAVDYWYATVNYVESGDTVLLDNGTWVRYIGVEAPGEGQYGREQSIELNKSLVLGQQVKLEVDPDNLYDSSGKLMAYVWVGEQVINYSMVRSGWARPLRSYGITSYQRWQWLLDQGQKEAQTERVGMWGTAQEAIIPGATIKYYTIEGSTAYELYDQLDKLGPDADGQNAVGLTQSQVWWDWRYVTNSYYGTCRITNYNVHDEIVVTLPRWSVPSNASPELIAKWNAYFASIVAHEKRHVDIVLEGIPQVERAMASASCDTVDESANAAWLQIQAKNEEFDTVTEHGTKDGVGLL